MTLDSGIDSGATNTLTVRAKLEPTGGSTNGLWVLVDDLAQTSGFSGNYATASPVGGVMGFLNRAAMNADFAGFFWQSNSATLAANKWISGTPTDVTSAVTATQDDAHGVYLLQIPYSAIGAGAAAGHTVRVYVLHGQPASGGGIHSAAPAPTPAQIESMNTAGAPGLTTLDFGAPDYVLK